MSVAQIRVLRKELNCSLTCVSMFVCLVACLLGIFVEPSAGLACMFFAMLSCAIQVCCNVVLNSVELTKLEQELREKRSDLDAMQGEAGR